MTAVAGRRSGGTTRADRGSVLVEVLFLMVLLTLPLFYLVATLAQAQAGAYAASAAAREAGRAFVTATDLDSAYQRANAASLLAVGSHGFDAPQLDLVITCGAPDCLVPGASVRIDVSISVGLPLIPDFMGGAVPTQVVLDATHIEVVDAFRGSGG